MANETNLSNGGILSLSVEHYEMLRKIILATLGTKCECLTCRAVKGLGASIVKHNKETSLGVDV